MTSTVENDERLATGSGAIQRGTALVRSWKTPIGLGVFAVIGLILFVGARREGPMNFRLSEERDLFVLPLIVTAAWLAILLFAVVVAVGGWAVLTGRRTGDARRIRVGVVVLVIGLAFVALVAFSPSTATLDAFAVPLAVAIVLVVIAAASALAVRRSGRAPVWMPAVFAFLFLFAFLVWAGAGATIPVPGLLVGAVGLSAPLIFGALGGVISERVGVVNVAIEGQLLAGAFISALVASLAQNPYAGLVAAPIAGALVSVVLAAFSIKYFVDQVIVGVVLNVLVTGLTNFLFSQVLSADAPTLNSPPRFPRIPIPLLGDIPVIGPVLFRQTLIVYLMYIAVIAVWYALFKTRWGLRLRSVGEHPQAADTVGIDVNRTRFWNVTLAGAIAGLGGAYFTLGSVGAFNREMTAGAGFIALAAVIFGRWDPVRATFAALLFGFATNLQNTLSIIGSPVPSEFMLMLPYLVTIFAVAGLVGRVRGPAASGKAYIKS